MITKENYMLFYKAFIKMFNQLNEKENIPNLPTPAYDNYICGKKETESNINIAFERLGKFIEEMEELGLNK